MASSFHIEPRGPRQAFVAPGEIDHHVSDMTATVAADVTLAALQARLAPHQQWLPVDGDPSNAIGDLVLRNSTGPLRLGYGAWRDLLLGAQFTDGEGQLVTAGRRVMKNVAGYDLTKFLVGTHGSIGKPVSLTIRTYLKPVGSIVARFAPTNAQARVRLLLSTDLRPQYAMLTRESLICGYLGDAATLAFYDAKLRTSADVKQLDRISLDDDVDLRRLTWSYHGRLRASVPPTNVDAFVRDARLERWAACATFGMVVSSDRVDADRVQSVAKSLGGWAIVFDDTGKPTNVPLDPIARQVFNRVQRSFDPNQQLAALP
jgi:FAD/FMN-containing dehydrogenase